MITYAMGQAAPPKIQFGIHLIFNYFLELIKTGC